MTTHARNEWDLDRRSLLGGGLALGGAAAATMLTGAHPAMAATGPRPEPTLVVTDLTGEAIQAAIDGLPPAGGTVQLVDGTYVIGTSVVLRSGCTLVGASRSGTILQLAPSAGAHVVVNADVANGNPNITVQSLTIDGNRAQQGAARNIDGIYLTRCSTVVLDDLETHDCVRTGCALTGEGVITRVGRVSNLYSHNNGYDGINAYHAMREMIYTNLTCDLNGNNGFDLGHSEGVINGVQCNRNAVDGFRINSDYSMQVHGVTADLNGRHGIALLALIDSVGSGWNAHNNGQRIAGADVFWDGGVITYGISDHTVVTGVACGPVHVSTWGDPYPTRTTSETYGMSFASNIVSNIAVLGVYNSGGKLGRYQLPPASSSSKLLIVEHEPGTPDFRIVRGNLDIGGGDLSHAAGGKVGFFGAAPAAKPTVTGKASTQPALKSLVTALAQLGLVTNKTT